MKFLCNIVAAFIISILCSCSSILESKEYGITVNYTIINSLDETVLLKDHNFSRGFLPVFIKANDTFSYVRKFTWTMERDRADVNTLPENEATYFFEIFTAGPHEDFLLQDTSAILGPDYPDDSLPDFSIEQNVQFYDTLHIRGDL